MAAAADLQAPSTQWRSRQLLRPGGLRSFEAVSYAKSGIASGSDTTTFDDGRVDTEASEFRDDCQQFSGRYIAKEGCRTEGFVEIVQGGCMGFLTTVDGSVPVTSDNVTLVMDRDPNVTAMLVDTSLNWTDGCTMVLDTVIDMHEPNLRADARRKGKGGPFAKGAKLPSRRPRGWNEKGKPAERLPESQHGFHRPSCWREPWSCESCPGDNDTNKFSKGNKDPYADLPPRRLSRRSQWCGEFFQSCTKAKFWKAACGLDEEFCTKPCSGTSSCGVSSVCLEGSGQCSCASTRDCLPNHVCVESASALPESEDAVSARGGGVCEKYCWSQRAAQKGPVGSSGEWPAVVTTRSTGRSASLPGCQKFACLKEGRHDKACCAVPSQASCWGNYVKVTGDACGDDFGETKFSTCCKLVTAAVRDFDMVEYKSDEKNTCEDCSGLGCVERFAEWSSIPCSVTCGVGTHVRVREATGTNCNKTNDTQELRVCVLAPCSCVWSPWTDWKSAESCGNSVTVFRLREKIGVESINGECQFREGRRVVGAWGPIHGDGAKWQWYETRTSDLGCCPIDCIWSAWEPWLNCPQTCGGSALTPRDRMRAIWQESTCGGLMCNGSAFDNQTCSSKPCPSDCVWGDWAWSGCSSTCGSSVSKGTRKIEKPAKFGGFICQGRSDEVRVCPKPSCPSVCEWTDWEPWTECSASCGVGERARMRSTAISKDFRNKTESGTCQDSGIDYELKHCRTNECAQNCVMSPWNDWADLCTSTCGGGRDVRYRSKLVEELHGGKCGVSTFELRICNPQICPVDCRWDTWGEWGGCDRPCDGGHRPRLRTATQMSRDGGLMCSGDSMELQVCNTMTCSATCGWSDWEDWGDCTQTCGREGRRKRRRGGTPQENVTEDSLVCNGHVEEVDVCFGGGFRCPEDCTWSNWGHVSACSCSCGGGVQVRARKILLPPRFGGACLGNSVSPAIKCNTHPCPVDCAISKWSEWGPPSRSCGARVEPALRFRYRHFDPAPAFGGRTCDAWLHRVEQRKTWVPICPIDCVWDHWEEWGICSLTCGSGTQVRTRMHFQEAAHGGKQCQHSPEGIAGCNTVECPINCEWAPWRKWSACSSSCGGGFKRRTRSTQNDAFVGGSPCSEEDGWQYDGCGAVACPVDCVRGFWGDWAACSMSCGGGVKTRFRSTLIQALAGGQECLDARRQSTECNTEQCPQDCKWREWSPWAICNVASGDGTRTRLRVVLSLATYGGSECTGGRFEIRGCGGEPVPQDCVWAPWSSWTGCMVSCGAGLRRRVRSELVEKRNAGAECEGSASELRSCADVLEPCPADCRWMDWGYWSACSTTCGGGLRSRSRGFTKSSYGGKACSGLQSETDDCASSICPIACEWENWSPWSSCSKTCGLGMTKRVRQIRSLAAFGGAPCTSRGQALRLCENSPCPQDCSLLSWGTWSACTRTCGTGERERFRGRIFERYGGRPCQTTTAVGTMKTACNMQACPLDGYWLDWGSWSACSSSCGGARLRKRQQRDPRFGGIKASGPASEDELCINECFRDCVWKEWGKWSSCGGPCDVMTQARMRSYAVEPLNGGTECKGVLYETRPCSLQSCSVDCVWGTWAAWKGTCVEEATCGSSWKTRVRSREPAGSHGLPCNGPSREVEKCIMDQCPFACVYEDWGPWLPCSASCKGTQKASRVSHGSDCTDAVVKTRLCNTDATDCKAATSGALLEDSVPISAHPLVKVLIPRASASSSVPHAIARDGHESRHSNDHRASSQVAMSHASNLSVGDDSMALRTTSRVNITEEMPPSLALALLDAVHRAAFDGRGALDVVDDGFPMREKAPPGTLPWVLLACILVLCMFARVGFAVPSVFEKWTSYRTARQNVFVLLCVWLGVGSLFGTALSVDGGDRGVGIDWLVGYAVHIFCVVQESCPQAALVFAVEAPPSRVPLILAWAVVGRAVFQAVLFGSGPSGADALCSWRRPLALGAAAWSLLLATVISMLQSRLGARDSGSDSEKDSAIIDTPTTRLWKVLLGDRLVNVWATTAATDTEDKARTWFKGADGKLRFTLMVPTALAAIATDVLLQAARPHLSLTALVQPQSYSLLGPPQIARRNPGTRATFAASSASVLAVLPLPELALCALALRRRQRPTADLGLTLTLLLMAFRLLVEEALDVVVPSSAGCGVVIALAALCAFAASPTAQATMSE
eukprot:TRINITY_DN73982_c0_g1_i1.p1 TRINITY_DN73982_c0_g1~~TRINITY_DN73982_c0_g1_i1.p1  ORF type:complete len:2196 (+),score=302.08 TRINITY_DN73982_c0_g1_i1:29-6589(+)